MKLWGGRFAKDTSRLVEEFTASIPFDQRLYRYDIAGSIAHCRMLAKQQILSSEEAETICAGLHEILGEIEGGRLQFCLDLEDIHLTIEARLQEKIGDLAGKLHTARSRNDQIALDLCLYLREAIADSVERLIGLQKAILDLAKKHCDVILPGYTHLQRAQPVLLPHHLLAYFEMFQRDIARLQDCYQRTDVLPLGSGALAGVPYPIDRESLAQELHFASISRNSIDAVSDRDFVIEYLAAASLSMMHLSRLAEDLILWSSSEFGFIELDDAYCTGSSIMPQKKNPDVAELVRAKTSRLYGHLVAMLVVLKALPLSYNRDLQEDKEALFDTVDTLLSCLAIFSPLLQTMKIRATRMRTAAEADFSLATDIADYLVRQGLPFRQAHEVVGKMVSWCLANGRTFADMTIEDYRRFSPLFAEDVYQITVETAVAARDCPGGTAPRRVGEAIEADEERLNQNAAWLQKVKQDIILPLIFRPHQT
ncbi:MAG: argininosuccinate lyase [Chloroflexi bacterium]|nr:argininosuccinate lyase [Chloroflexota bacterium]MCL5074919.1 argininosuccinate lyase [Chloroflexota bacterium]